MEGLEPLLANHGIVRGGAADALAAISQVVATLYRAPAAGLLEDLRNGRLADVTDGLARWVGVAAPRGPHAPPVAAALGAAYVRLFVSRAGGVPAPPYVGLVRDRTLMGPSVWRLRSEMQGLGLRLGAEWRELPDHVALVAEAVDLLLERGRTAAAMGLAAGYLAPWFDRFAEAVAEHDQGGFYGELSRFLRDALTDVVAVFEGGVRCP